MYRKFFVTVLALSPGLNTCPALAQEGKDHNARALSAPITAPLRQARNPNYFEDASGTPLILCGSHTWNTLQDWGSKGAVRPLDFEAFVSFLKAHGHNFTLLWCTELPKFRGLPSTESFPPDFTVSPFPWMLRIPGQIGQRFQFNSDSDSNPFRTGIPIQIGHRFRFEIGHFFRGPGMVSEMDRNRTRRTRAALDKSAAWSLFQNEKGDQCPDKPNPCVKS